MCLSASSSGCITGEVTPMVMPRSSLSCPWLTGQCVCVSVCVFLFILPLFVILNHASLNHSNEVTVTPTCIVMISHIVHHLNEDFTVYIFYIQKMYYVYGYSIQFAYINCVNTWLKESVFVMLTGWSPNPHPTWTMWTMPILEVSLFL